MDLVVWCFVNQSNLHFFIQRDTPFKGLQPVDSGKVVFCRETLKAETITRVYPSNGGFNSPT